MGEKLNAFILIVLSISTVIQVLDMCGFLPRKVRKFLRLNHSEDTMDVLKEFGINIDMYRRNNATVGIPRDYSRETLEEDLEKKLNELKIDKMVSVGKVRKTKLDYYIDLIGHSCNPNVALAYARTLSSHWAHVVENTSEVQNPSVDFIVTPKGGAPILGYEFSKLLNLPFLLHESEERFTCEKDDMRRFFDCAEVPVPGSRALVVDDSTTGGRMVIETITHLRQYGYEVSECLVVFEPQSKDARKKLINQGVNLISVVKTHSSS